MSARRDFPVGKQVHHGHPYFPTVTVSFAVAAIALGVGVILALPDDPDPKPQAASAAASAPETTGSANTAATGSTNTAADDSLCDKQAWPYVDQRCAQRVEAARGMREVRIVTDKGNSVTVKSPEPIVEPKPKPAPPPVVARADKPIGPPAAPVAESPPQVEKVVAAPQQPPQAAAPAPEIPAPQAAPEPAAAPNVQVTVAPRAAPANPPAVSDPVPRDTSNPSGNTRSASVAPAETSTAPMAAGVDVFADRPPRKYKSARAAERAERRAARQAERAARREARRQRMMEEAGGGLPEEVAATARSLPADGQDSRRRRDGQDSRRTRDADRARGAVPDEVVEAVEQAAASESRGRRGREREVVIDSPRGGSRIYVVPREEIGGW